MEQLIQEEKYGLEQIPAMAKKLLDSAKNCRVFLFEAEMGSGKTTLIHEMCKQLGSRDNFSSPTFSLINEYHYPGGKIYHIDLYRLKNEEELLDLGIEEYLDSGHYVFIEWPGFVKPLVNFQHIEVSLKPENNFRYLSARKIIPL